MQKIWKVKVLIKSKFTYKNIKGHIINGYYFKEVYMELYSLFLIALALSLDAFGVALSIGLNNNLKSINKLFFCLSFGFFQFLFSFLGGIVGAYFLKYISEMPSIIGGAIISVVGVMMVKEGMEGKSESIIFSPKMYVILGISVSIDAMIVGFTVLNSVLFLTLVYYACFIGLVALVMSLVAFFISKFLNKIYLISKYADFIGGTILILFGFKMMFF
jgi:Predicted membrane protein